MTELVVCAAVEELNTVLEFVQEQLDRYECGIKEAMRIQIAVEEIFVNIANYAYEGETGTAKIQVTYIEDISSIRITMIDSGKQYNPLLKEDPDITLSAEERPIGGLGIFMVKKTMDKVDYEYKDGQNCLTITTTI